MCFTNCRRQRTQSAEFARTWVGGLLVKKSRSCHAHVQTHTQRGCKGMPHLQLACSYPEHLLVDNWFRSQELFDLLSPWPFFTACVLLWSSFAQTNVTCVYNKQMLEPFLHSSTLTMCFMCKPFQMTPGKQWKTHIPTLYLRGDNLSQIHIYLDEGYIGCESSQTPQPLTGCLECVFNLLGRLHTFQVLTVRTLKTDPPDPSENTDVLVRPCGVRRLRIGR